MHSKEKYLGQILIALMARKRGISSLLRFSIFAALPVLILLECHSSMSSITNPAWLSQRLYDDKGWWNDQVVDDFSPLLGCAWIGTFNGDE